MQHSVAYNHTSLAPRVIPFGPATDPAAAGQTESPCKLRPDTGMPCMLLNYPKDNTSCENCALLGKGDCVTPEEYKPQYRASKDRRMVGCKFPGCTKNTRSIRGYCKSCNILINSRVWSWKQKNGETEPPESFLHRPREHKYKGSIE